MRITITLSKENEKYIKSIKGYGESMSSAINKAINYTKIYDEQNKKYINLMNELKSLKTDEEVYFNISENDEFEQLKSDFLQGFGENDYIDINYMKKLKKSIEK